MRRSKASLRWATSWERCWLRPAPVALFTSKVSSPTRVFNRHSPAQADFFPSVLMDLKGLRSIRQQLIAPLIILALVDVILVTECCDGLALQAFEYDPGVGVPLPYFHGCPPELSASVFSVPWPLSSWGAV